MKFEKFKNEENTFGQVPKAYKAKRKYWKFFFVLFVFISLLFTICFFHLLNTFEYEKVFDGINIESKYDESDLASLLPFVSFELKNKNFKLDHRLIPTRFDKYLSLDSLGSFLKSDTVNEVDESFFLNAWNILWASFASLTQNMPFESNYNKSFELKQHSGYRFKVEKMKLTNTSGIECFAVDIKNKLERPRTTGETEVCFDLGNNSWFGGHESYYQPYWPINTQVFNYVAYVTGLSLALIFSIATFIFFN